MEGSSINSIDKYGESQDSMPVSRVTSSINGEYIILGGKKYHKHELYTAFAGTFQTERYAPAPAHEFANASAYGLAGFGTTTLILACLLTGGGGVSVTNIVVGCMVFSGGLSLFLAGMWEFFIGNTFAYTAFTSFGAFWLAFAAINIPSFGIAAAYGEDAAQFSNAIGFFLIGWVIFITMLVLFTLKATASFVFTFVILDVTFILLAVHYILMSHKVLLAGAACAVVTALMGWYNMYAGMATPTNSYFIPPVYPLPVWEPKKK